MPFVRTKSVGNYKMVLGFDPPSLDPVASERVIRPLFEKTDEFKIMAKLGERFGELEQRRQGILRHSRTARTREALTEAQGAYEQIVKEQKDIQAKAAAAKPALITKRLELLKEHGVRFGIGGVEEIDQETSDMLTSKFASLKDDEMLLLDGTIKQKYEMEAEMETARIAALTQEEKTAEKEALLIEALRDAETKRRRYEIQDRADPLAESKAWYNDRCAQIEERYT